jgi:hypothetical protein
MAYGYGGDGFADNGEWHRACKGSTRPPHVAKEFWQEWGPKTKQAEMDRYEEHHRTDPMGEKRRQALGYPNAQGPLLPAPGESLDPVHAPAVAVSEAPIAEGLEELGIWARGELQRALTICSMVCAAPDLIQSESEVADSFENCIDDATRMHRPKTTPPTPFSACVARPVTKKEIAAPPKTQEACAKEWTRLHAIGCWDESCVRKWRSEASEAKQSGTKVHIGRVFLICVEKNADSPKDNPARTLKGRVVFEGSYVRGESWDIALFHDLSSCPATMEAAKVADAYGLMPNNN